MYRFISDLIHPFTLIALGQVVALMMLWRRPTRVRRVVVGTLTVLLLVVTSPITAYLAMASLEWSYPPDEEPYAQAGAIVVLSGGMRLYDHQGKHVEPGADTAMRCLHAAEVYRRGPARPVVVSGGRVDPSTPGPSLAQVMHDLLVQLGVPANQILIEGESSTTYENAKFSERLLRQRNIGRVVLVTDAAHLRRGLGCFRAVGLEVTPAPCNHYAGRFTWSPSKFLPNVDAAGAVEYAAHEWIGLAWYHLHGRVASGR